MRSIIEVRENMGFVCTGEINQLDQRGLLYPYSPEVNLGPDVCFFSQSLMSYLDDIHFPGSQRVLRTGGWFLYKLFAFNRQIGKMGTKPKMRTDVFF